MFIDTLNRHRIILASKSPRRQQLLKDLGIRFEVIMTDYNETYPAGLSGREIAEFLSAQKASVFRNRIAGNDVVITADTIVWCSGEVLGKPATKDEAVRMIRVLCGNTHEVVTGVTILSVAGEKTFSESTKVTFESLSDEEIEYYVDTCKPYDKAGAYGIQEWIGYAACSRIEGSYFNVVGLPVHRLIREMNSFLG